MKANSYLSEIVVSIYPKTKKEALGALLFALFCCFVSRYLALLITHGEFPFVLIFLLFVCIAPGLYYVFRFIGDGCVLSLIRLLLFPLIGLLYLPAMVVFSILRLMGYKFMNYRQDGKLKAGFKK